MSACDVARTPALYDSVSRQRMAAATTEKKGRVAVETETRGATPIVPLREASRLFEKASLAARLLPLAIYWLLLLCCGLPLLSPHLLQPPLPLRLLLPVDLLLPPLRLLIALPLHHTAPVYQHVCGQHLPHVLHLRGEVVQLRVGERDGLGLLCAAQ